MIEVSLSDDVEALIAPLTEIDGGSTPPGCDYSSLQDLGPSVWQLGSFVATVGQDATLSRRAPRPRR